MGDQKNELSDEKLYELAEKEYDEIFHKYNIEEKEEKKRRRKRGRKKRWKKRRK